MKHSKLLLAFVAGVAATLLINNGPMPGPLTGFIGSGFLATLALIALLIYVAFLTSCMASQPVAGQDAQAGNQGEVFQWLRRLRTSKTDAWVGGVCGGLGETTSIPAWIWRLGFAVMFAAGVYCYGTGVPANILETGLGVYLLLCLLLPSGAGGATAGEAVRAAGFLEFLRRLKRSRTDCQFGGVCGGLAEVTPVPAWVWRFGFVVAVFYFGTGLLAYFLLWLCLPEGDAKKPITA